MNTSQPSRSWLIVAGAVIIAGSAFVVGGGASDGARAMPPRPPLAVDQGNWRALPPAPRTRGFQQLAAVSAKHTMIVIAGATYEQDQMGSLLYRPALERWKLLDGPRLRWRAHYTATAAGPRVFVWGGATGGGARDDGAVFNVRRASWRRLPSGPLGGRFGHSAVWTGSELIIFGGARSGIAPDGTRSGAAFDPATRSWHRIARAPTRRRTRQVAVWTGEGMIVWGGFARLSQDAAPREPLRGGASYDPRRDRWTKIARAPLPPAEQTAAAWTGEAMLVWNGRRGATYDPSSDTWRVIPESPLSDRTNYSATWSGGRFYVWGGITAGCGDCYLANGAAYDPDRRTWSMLPPTRLEGRSGSAAAPRHRGMLIWGGCCAGGGYFDDGAQYRPAR